MQELLDEPIHASSNFPTLPTRVKLIGLLLVVIWGAFLYLDISALFIVEHYKPISHIGLLVLYFILMGQGSIYKQPVIREKHRKHALILLFPAVGVLFCYFSPYLWTGIWTSLFGLILLGGLTYFIIILLEAQPQAARIWSWLKVMVAAWTVALFTRYYSIYSENETIFLFYQYSYFLFLLFTLYHSFQFYKKRPSNSPWSKPTALFIACTHLVILGQIGSYSSYYYSEYAQALVLAGIGGMGLTALYAWIKTAPVDSSQNSSTSD